MKKIIFLSLACFLGARENPFLPTGELNTDVVVTNLKQEFEPLSELKISLDKGDMLLDEVVLYTVQKDGSKRKQVIKVNKSIDASEPYVLTPVKNTVCKPCEIPPPVPEVISLNISEPTKEQKQDVANSPIITPAPKTANLEPSVEILVAPAKDEPAKLSEQMLDDKITQSPQKPATKPPKQPSVKDSFKFKNLARFEISDSVVKIYTSAKLARDFAYKNEKIVLDFNAKFRQFLTFSRRIKSAGFELVNIGAHSGYFRVVIVPKKFKSYILRSIKGGYELEI